MQKIGYAIVIRGKYDGIYEVIMCKDMETAIRKFEERFKRDLKEYIPEQVIRVLNGEENIKQIYTSDEDIITYTIEEVYNGD